MGLLDGVTDSEALGRLSPTDLQLLGEAAVNTALIEEMIVDFLSEILRVEMEDLYVVLGSTTIGPKVERLEKVVRRLPASDNLVKALLPALTKVGVAIADRNTLLHSVWTYRNYLSYIAGTSRVEDAQAIDLRNPMKAPVSASEISHMAQRIVEAHRRLEELHLTFVIANRIERWKAEYAAELRKKNLGRETSP